MASAIKLTGIKAVARALDRLPKELQRQAEVSVLRAGVSPIRSAAKANLKRSRRTGTLHKSLGTRVSKLRSGQYTGRVGIRKGSATIIGGKKVNPVKYAHLVEYGTSHSAAKPFIRPAIQSAQGQILGAMAKGYDRYMTRVVRKIRAR